MAALIDRPEYLDQLIQNKDVDLVKIVTGIRRCGKSSLLDLFHQYLTDSGLPDENILHMNLESLRYRNLTDYLSFYDHVSGHIAKTGKTYLIFDELQVVEHWEKAIESFRLDFDVDIYITGSNAYWKAFIPLLSCAIFYSVIIRLTRTCCRRSCCSSVPISAASLRPTASEMFCPLRATFRAEKGEI